MVSLYFGDTILNSLTIHGSPKVLARIWGMPPKSTEIKVRSLLCDAVVKALSCTPFPATALSLTRIGCYTER